MALRSIVIVITLLFMYQQFACFSSQATSMPPLEEGNSADMARDSQGVTEAPTQGGSPPDQGEIRRDKVKTAFTVIGPIVALVGAILIAVYQYKKQKKLKKREQANGTNGDSKTPVTAGHSLQVETKQMSVFGNNYNKVTYNNMDKELELLSTSNAEPAIQNTENETQLKKMDDVEGVAKEAQNHQTGCDSSPVDPNDPRQQFYDILIIHNQEDHQEYEAVKNVADENNYKSISVHELPAGPSDFDIFNVMLGRWSYAILVMTQKFLEDKWTKEQYQTALTDSIEKQADSVIPFIFDDINIPIPAYLKKLSSLNISSRFLQSQLRSSIKTSIRQEREFEANMPQNTPESSSLDPTSKKGQTSSFLFKMVMDLSKLLNREHPMDQDWKQLAVALNLSMDDIAQMEEPGSNPTKKILEVWQQHGKTVYDLRAKLKEMDRGDCLAVVNDYMPSDWIQSDDDNSDVDDDEDDVKSPSEVLSETLPDPDPHDPNKALLTSQWGQEFLRQGSDGDRGLKDSMDISKVDSKGDNKNCSQPPNGPKSTKDKAKKVLPKSSHPEVAYQSLRADDMCEEKDDRKKTTQSGYQDLSSASLEADGDDVDIPEVAERVAERRNKAFPSNDISGKIEMMSLEASLKGFEVVNVPGDGSCMFHAVVHQLESLGRRYSEENELNQAKSLRKNLVKYLDDNPVCAGGPYKNFVSAPVSASEVGNADTGPRTREDDAIDRVPDIGQQQELRWQKHLTDLQSETTYGEHCDLVGLSELLGVNINVLKLEGDSLIPVQIPCKKATTSEAINLGLIGQSHYVSLIPTAANRVCP